MSARFGSPTNGYGSGTEKEFRDALTAWKTAGTPWILFYFEDQPALSSTPADVAQYLQVCQFRQEQQIAEPAFWRSGKWNGANQPVVGVSFWEAEAFAKWARGCLPTEQQWEAAARGPEGLIYPWGDEWVDGICNTSEAGLNVTSPVGAFPRSRSNAFGLEDAAGNVWEWCMDVNQNVAIDYVDGKVVYGVGRVVRGGCWDLNSQVARSGVRYWWRPVNRLIVGGFRVLCFCSSGLA